ncbi:hypothetical protein NCAS_0A12460 [Naumovozyma castellii]|uniref:Peptidase A1 domain-containing protein n=1 Tax=Naumovozyma castellii TaxID=27288 RepID=G0V8K5_NAUCA|nr:hypothetical protein NCAS_0A12460 [Naumovozyma castellii CBS 4309]CCC67804.1 hypothetical protein NCAS_0A12460 [Naumovozyma castellii CBS 4309]
MLQIGPILLLLSLFGIHALSSPVGTAGKQEPNLRSSKNQYAKRNSGSGHLEIELQHIEQTYYATTLEIGTPPQNLTVLFDSGSSDLWVMDASNPYCESQYTGSQTYNGSSINQASTIDCSSFMTFNKSLSSSFKTKGTSRFYAYYSDKTFADGSWATEKLTMNGVDVSSLQFGLGNCVTTPVSGVLGIGFPRRESVKGYDNAPNEFYPNFPQVLKNQGIIDVVAYSMFLNKLESDTGSILFGAIDTSKYTGDLVTFPMLNIYPDVTDKPATLMVILQGLGAQDNANCKAETFVTSKIPVLLDSGTTLMGAPKEIADMMADFMNATFSEDEGIYIMECPTKETLANTDYIFDFGGVQIKVPLSNFILSAQSEGGPCGFAVLPDDSNTMVLGDIFLSSAYVVFDLDNYQISLAAANLDNNVSLEDSIINIPSDGNIPNAKMATVDPWSTYETFTVTSAIATACTKPISSSSSSSSSLHPSSQLTTTKPDDSHIPSSLATTTADAPEQLSSQVEIVYKTKTETIHSTVVIGVCNAKSYTTLTN